MPDEAQQQQHLHANNWYFTRGELETTGPDIHRLHYKMAAFIQALGRQISVYVTSLTFVRI